MPQASLSDVPDFEKPIASKLRLVPGNDPDAIAHVNSPNPILGSDNKVYEDDPQAVTQPILNHEVFHEIQTRAGGAKEDSRNGESYDYGGPAGLMAMRRRGATIGKLNSEQQAQVLQDYTAKRAALEAKQKAGTVTAQDLAQADFLDKAYAPFLRQEQNMAQPGMDTTPQPPGPPPAALTGMAPPLPGMGGQTLYATHQQTGHRIMTKDGGKSWQPAQ